MFLRIPTFYDQLEKIVRKSIKTSVTREDFVELLDRTGLDQSDMRKLRRALPGIFYSEYDCIKGNKLLDAEATELLGPCVAIEPSNAKCCCVGAAPTTVKQLKAALKKLDLSTNGKKEELAARYLAATSKQSSAACSCGANTSKPYEIMDLPRVIKALLPATLMPQLQPEENDKESVMEDAAEAKKVLKETIAKLQESQPGAKEVDLLSKRLVKLEDGLQMIQRTWMFEGINLCDVKENCCGTLIHRQPLAGYEHIEVVVKLTADGRLIYRMLETQKSSSQTAYTIKIPNSALKVNSVANTFNLGAHNGKDSIENMADALLKFNQWKKEFDNGLITLEQEVLLPNPRYKEGGTEPRYIQVTSVTAKVKLIMCLDGATQFSMCPETCGPGAKKPCNRCGTKKDRHTKDDKGEMCENIGALCELIRIKSGEHTKRALADKYMLGTDARLIDMINSPLSAPIRETALHDLTINKGSGSDTDKCNTVPLDLTKFGFDEPITFTGDQDRHIRVRLLWPSDRAL